MKRNVVLKLAIVICLFAVAPAYSQDHHFSQYDMSLQYLNPALTGMTIDEPYAWRANTIYRSQWRSIASKPFTNQLMAYDMPFKKSIGLGGYILNNRAGAGQLNTLNVMLSGAYEITIDPTNKHNLFGGLQVGIFHRSLNVSDLIFDSQFSTATNTYDPSINSGENISNKAIVRFDANLGFYYKYFDKLKKVSPHAGLSLFRVAMPNESLTGEINRLPIRWLFTGGCDYIVNEKITFSPGLFFMTQAKVTDISLSALFDYKFDNSKYSAIGGLTYRFKDAVIVRGGLKYGRNIFSISYDLNVSYLKPYTHIRGGLEIGIIYINDKPWGLSRMKMM